MQTHQSPSPLRKLLGQVRDRLRALDYAMRTEDAYVLWIRRYMLFRGKRHPIELGGPEAEAFLASLAVERRVSAGRPQGTGSCARAERRSVRRRRDRQ